MLAPQVEYATPPNAFTEHGVVILTSIVRNKAVNANISIVRFLSHFAKWPMHNKAVVQKNSGNGKATGYFKKFSPSPGNRPV